MGGGSVEGFGEKEWRGGTSCFHPCPPPLPPPRQLLLRHPVGGEGPANLEVADDVMDTGAVLGEPLGEQVGGGGLQNDPMKTLLTTKYQKCPLAHKK